MKHHFLTSPLRWLLFFITGILFGLILSGAQQGRERMSNRVIDWLPGGFQETKDFNWFLQHFYEGELLMVSWEGCTANDERLDVIAQKLLTPSDMNIEGYYWKVLTSGAVFRELTGKPLNLSEEEAQDRMKGWILSKDGSQGSLVAFFSEQGYNDSKAAIETIRQCVGEVTQLPPTEFAMAGPTIDSLAMDAASKKSQDQLLPFFLFVCALILFALLRSWIGVFSIFVTAIFNEELSCALIFYSGHHTDSISLLCCSLVFVLTISGGLHLLNYYRDHLAEIGRKGAVIGAMKKAAIPCLLACLTTILGLSSLAASQVIPIRRFGIFASVGLLLGTIALFLLMGTFLEEFPIKKWIKIKTDEQIDPPQKNLQEGFFVNLVIRYYILSVAVSLFLLVVGACYLPQLKTTVTFRGMFPPNAPVIQEYDYLEERIGALVPIEVVLNIPNKDNEEITWLDQLSLIETVEQSLWDVNGIECSLSALNFIPWLPDRDQTGASATTSRTLFNKMVSNRIELLSKSCLFDDRELQEDQNMGMEPAKRWRISLRGNAGEQLAYGPLVEEIQQVTQRVIGENEKEFGIHGASAMITGGIPLVHKAQQQLLDDLLVSYLSACLLILVTLIILLRSIVAGVIAMIPNLFPSMIVFGAMAAMNQSVDMGTMMTASVALGISVDGTIHFITWFKRGMAERMSQDDAVRFAYHRCSAAIIQATLVCGGGMLVFTMSNFIPISRFAWMLSLLLAIALFGDLVLFPAMLVGPWGRFFRPNTAISLRKQR